MQIRPDTYTDEFDSASVFQADDYLYFYENSLRDENTEREVAFLVRKLGLSGRKRILDLACGHGRHANRLAMLKHEVTGVDINQDFLDMAEKEAARIGVPVRYIAADLRRYSDPAAFDSVIHLFSSFGYFSNEENRQVLRNIADSLRPGGLFCLDILNRDGFLRDFPRYGVLEKGRDLLIDRNRFDPCSGRLYNERILIRDGKRRDTPFFLRLYNLSEILSLFEGAGIALRKIYGGWDGRSFDAESKRMILIGEKREASQEEGPG